MQQRLTGFEVSHLVKNKGLDIQPVEGKVFNTAAFKYHEIEVPAGGYYPTEIVPSDIAVPTYRQDDILNCLREDHNIHVYVIPGFENHENDDTSEKPSEYVGFVVTGDESEEDPFDTYQKALENGLRVGLSLLPNQGEKGIDTILTENSTDELED